MRRKVKKDTRHQVGGTLIGMFIGLVFGILLAAGVVLYVNKSPLPFKKDVMSSRGEVANRPARMGDPAALPGRTDDAAGGKRFQFYDILPEGGSAALPAPAGNKPDGRGQVEAEAERALRALQGGAANEQVAKFGAKNAANEKADKADKAAAKTKARTYLQVGSFSKAHDADNQKAKLALMGIEAAVQQVMVQDKTYYRVRVGPVEGSEVKTLQTDLSAFGIASQVVR